MKDTIVGNLRNDAEEIHDLLEALLANSHIGRWHNPDTSNVVFIGGHFAWEPLSDEGCRIQAELLEKYRRFASLEQVLLSEQPDTTLTQFKENDKQVLDFIQQQEFLFHDSPRTYLDRAFAALEIQIGLLERLYSQTEDRAIFVPDSNALLHNPDLDQWRFSGVSEFSIMITEPVFAELDILKVSHRVDTVREKAEKIIRMVKEYRRRAQSQKRKLAEGVVLVKGVSEIAIVAIPPRMNWSLPWLKKENRDDQILASTIEVMRRNARSAVFLVTRDLNLQNKCELANVPFVEPPDPL